MAVALERLPNMFVHRLQHCTLYLCASWLTETVFGCGGERSSAVTDMTANEFRSADASSHDAENTLSDPFIVVDSNTDRLARSETERSRSLNDTCMCISVSQAHRETQTMVTGGQLVAGTGDQRR